MTGANGTKKISPEVIATQVDSSASGKSDPDATIDGSAGYGISDKDQASTQPKSIGPYQLIRKLGEGGMGQVWLAEQTVPIHRQVALKLIKVGMYDDNVLHRFQSERQSLAMMDHPAIAKVFDAGATPDGQPYFVMEYVTGIPITQYCDQKRLTIKQRLELFIKVCEGVQHAHQKAIIHRDLKPANILVTEVDGKPVPRIIDFGLAKATTPDLGSETMFTRVGAFVGTPGYMSPEQANSTVQDVDTRTDVYSLGVVLYVLLTGAQPFDTEQWNKLPLYEMLRQLREVEPPRPSTQIRMEKPSSASSAELRGLQPKQLETLLHGDLDWITMKALEKDRARRYGSPMELAADIGRYLDDEPVTARPDSVSYRAKKYVLRHKALVAGTTAVFLVLVAGVVTSTWEALKARRAEARTKQESAIAQAVNDFLQNDLLAQASAATQSGPSAKPDPHLEVRTVLDRAAARIEGKFAKQPEVEAAIRSTIGQTYYELGLFPEATKQLEKALDLRRRLSGPEYLDTLSVMNRLANVYDDEGKYAQAEALDNQSLEIQRRVLGPEHRDTLRSMNNLAIIYRHEGKYAQAEVLLSQALEIKRRVLGPDHPNTLKSMGNLANVYHDEGKYAQAEILFSQTLEILRRVSGPEHPDTLTSMSNLANIYEDEGKYAQAETLHSQTLEIKRRVLGPEHPVTLESMSNLANIYVDEGKYAQAEALHSQTLEIKRRVLGPEHPNTLDTLAGFAVMYQRQGKYALAETYAAQVLAGRRHALGSEHPDTMASAASLALAYVSEGKFAESDPLAREAVDTDSRIQPEDWQRFRAESLLGASLAGEKKYAEAEPLLLEAYRGMVARKDRIAFPDRYHLELARQWLVQLYKDWGKPEKAAEVAKELER